MKNKLLLSAIILSLSLLPAISGAEETGASVEVNARLETQKREENKNETIKDRLEDKREAVKGEIEERKENATEQIQKRLHKFVEKVIERFNAAIERLEKLASRIQSRITKLESENVNTTKAKELLVIAKAKIEIAKTSIASINLTNITSTTTATSTNKIILKARFQEIKNQIEMVKKNIKEAHAALIEVVKNLKPGRNGNGNATSTASTTPNTN